MTIHTEGTPTGLKAMLRSALYSNRGPSAFGKASPDAGKIERDLDYQDMGTGQIKRQSEYWADFFEVHCFH